MPANVCGHDVDNLLTGASFEELTNQNISPQEESEPNGNEELPEGERDGGDTLLEDDIIKAALCALQTPSSTPDSSPSRGEDLNANKEESESDYVIEVDDLPSSEGTLTANEDSDNELSTNQNIDDELSTNQSTVNIELQFDDEEVPLHKDTFHEEGSLSKMENFVTSIPLVKPPPMIIPPTQPVSLPQNARTHPMQIRPQTAFQRNHNATHPPQRIMYIQYIPVAAQPPQMMTQFMQPPSFVPRPQIAPVSITPATRPVVNATPSINPITTTKPKPTENKSDEDDDDDVPLAKISNVTSLKMSTNLNGTLHSTEVERSHICDVCGAGFQWRSHLRRHQKTHTNEKFECDICHAGFGQQSYFNAHYKSHFNDKPYKCEACGKRFVQSTHLKIHLMIHTGEKPYQCQYCKARFTQHGNLKRHIRVHTGERPYPCTECPSSFTHSSDLTRHIRIHTGEKPYKCAHCSSAFATNGNLKSHLKIHTNANVNPFKCSLCHSAFNLESYLKLHMRTHIHERPFVCACGETFDQGLNFNFHLKLRVSPFCSQVT
eukprot:TCONS_00020216-protein